MGPSCTDGCGRSGVWEKNAHTPMLDPESVRNRGSMGPRAGTQLGAFSRIRNLKGPGVLRLPTRCPRTVRTVEPVIRPLHPTPFLKNYLRRIGRVGIRIQAPRLLSRHRRLNTATRTFISEGVRESGRGLFRHRLFGHGFWRVCRGLRAVLGVSKATTRCQTLPVHYEGPPRICGHSRRGEWACSRSLPRFPEALLIS